MCLIAAQLLQSWSSLCLHSGSGLLLSCFYITSLRLWQFLWVVRRRVVFSPSSLCVLSQKTWRNRQPNFWIHWFDIECIIIALLYISLFFEDFLKFLCIDLKKKILLFSGDLFHVISFFPDCYWLLVGKYKLCCGFYMGGYSVFIFVRVRLLDIS